jgi:hypothetical protein
MVEGGRGRGGGILDCTEHVNPRPKMLLDHKVRIFKEYYSVCPLVGIRTLPTTLSPASVPLPQIRGDAHSPAMEGVGESQFRRLEKKLSTLPIMCVGL